MTRPMPDTTHLAYLATIMPDDRPQVNPLTWCCARLLRRAHYPRQFGGGGGIQLFAVRSTQFGAGDMVVVMDQTILQTGYGFPPN